MAMGPLRLLDEIGLGHCVTSRPRAVVAFPERIIASPLLVSMYKAGRMGRKAGAGFFLYPAGLAAEERGRNDPAVAGVIAKWVCALRRLRAKRLSIAFCCRWCWKPRACSRRVSPAIPARSIWACCSDWVSRQRGGLLWWADTLGADQIVQRLQPMSPIGPRMLPSTLLADMAERGLRFYGDVGEAGARPLESRL